MMRRFGVENYKSWCKLHDSNEYGIGEHGLGARAALNYFLMEYTVNNKECWTHGENIPTECKHNMYQNVWYSTM